MQKQPKIYNLEYVPCDLNKEFPITGPWTHYQVDKEITSLHQHNCLELGYCHSGSGIFIVDQKVIPYQQGDISIINDREMHLAQSAPGTISTWDFFLVLPAQLIKIISNSGNNQILDIANICGKDFRNIISEKDHPEIATIIKMTFTEIREKKSDWKNSVRGYILSLMVLLHRLPGVKKYNKLSENNIDRIAPALTYISNNYDKSFNFENLAESCHLSPTHFRRIFKETIGYSAKEYLKRLRVSMACSLLLSTNLSIIEISGKVGYPSLSGLNRHFKSIMKKSPLEYRKNKYSDF